MKTFPGWRMAGRAMRWARRQEGVVYKRTAMEGSWRGDQPPAVHVDHKWRSGRERSVLVSHSSILATVDVLAGADDGTDVQMTYVDNTARILRVLAALDLIPAELAVDDA